MNEWDYVDCERCLSQNTFKSTIRWESAGLLKGGFRIGETEFNTLYHVWRSLVSSQKVQIVKTMHGFQNILTLRCLPFNSIFQDFSVGSLSCQWYSWEKRLHSSNYWPCLFFPFAENLSIDPCHCLEHSKQLCLMFWKVDLQLQRLV